VTRNPTHHWTYLAIGTSWAISLWDEIPEKDIEEMKRLIAEKSEAFEATYSRFRKTSLLWQLTERRGVVPVPKDLITMLRLYETLHDLSDGKLNPLIGFTISDMGYDAEKSLQPKEVIRDVPDFHKALTIFDDETIELHESVLMDLGALGKGYFVDQLAKFLAERGLKHFLVNGSGDISYKGNGDALRIGLEHPGDPTKAIGIVEMTDGCMCSSAGNRRKWATYHHTIDPHTRTSPNEILATWVIAKSTAIADGLATCLFFTEPERYEKDFSFEYCIMNKENKIKRSAGFTAELF
jgi:thiamine biosynthesis lipoprotein